MSLWREYGNIGIDFDKFNLRNRDNPIVFFEITMNGVPAGRIYLELLHAEVPEAAEKALTFFIGDPDDRSSTGYLNSFINIDESKTIRFGKRSRAANTIVKPFVLPATRPMINHSKNEYYMYLCCETEGIFTQSACLVPGIARMNNKESCACARIVGELNLNTIKKIYAVENSSIKNLDIVICCCGQL